MASCNSRLKTWHKVPIDLDEILSIAAKALELDPNLGEAYAAQGEALNASSAEG